MSEPDTDCEAILACLQDMLRHYRMESPERQREIREEIMPHQFRAFHSSFLAIGQGGPVLNCDPTPEERKLGLFVLGNIFVLTEEGFLKNDNHNGMKLVYESENKTVTEPIKLPGDHDGEFSKHEVGAGSGIPKVLELLRRYCPDKASEELAGGMFLAVLDNNIVVVPHGDGKHYLAMAMRLGRFMIRHCDNLESVFHLQKQLTGVLMFVSDEVVPMDGQNRKAIIAYLRATRS
jgi:hypothetical protein